VIVPAPIVSYAQNFEDVLLWRALGDVPAGVYIDIGAQDPIVDSVSKAFYEQGWRGLHVEPSPSCAESLRRDRPDETVVEAAVSDRPGGLKFYEIAGSGMSTGSKQIAEACRQNGWSVLERLVPAVTLDQVFAKIASDEIHWLKIDVEGLEHAVLEGWRDSPRRPWVAVIESTYPSTRRTETHRRWEPLLIAKGYSFVHFDGLNRYYLSSAHPELAEHFRYGPSIWDDFQLPESSRLVRSLARRQDEYLDRVQAEAEMERRALFDQLAAARAEITAKNTQIDRWWASADRALQDIAGLKGSWSWRITRPIRQVRRVGHSIATVFRRAIGLAPD
jgi:FkbM family methyltransferase